MMEEKKIKRYSKRGILFHWTFSFVVMVLLITGTEMFIPGKSAGGGHVVGMAHRIAAVLFISLPLLYTFLSRKTAVVFLKETFNWSRDDLRWFMKAPAYYFGGSGKGMPDQGSLNTGQKMWQLILFKTATVFLITGAAMWLFRSAIAIVIYQWLLFVHGAAFVIFILMLTVHLYMAALHPRMRGAFSSMIDGKISLEYIRKHRRKWYDEIIREKSGREEKND